MVREISHFFIDVDGVMTDGSFFYSAEGKVFKRFGPEDADALQVLRRYLTIEFVTADFRGLEISRTRIEKDMGFPLTLVPSSKRLEWISSMNPLGKSAYIGDSFADVPILQNVALGISTSNGSAYAQRVASFVTTNPGGSGAVAEACFMIANKLGLTPKEFSFLRD